MRINNKIKKTLTFVATVGLGIFGLTACGSDSSIPAVEGGFGKAPKIAAGEKGKEPKELKKAVLVEGKGQACGANAILKTNYTGQLWNGKVFDSSFDRGGKGKDGKGKTSSQPAVFPLNGVIKGWQDGLKDAKPGSRVELVIPPSLGYGEQDSKSIPKNSTLVFVVDILQCFNEKNTKAGFARLKKAKATGDSISGINIEGALGTQPKILVTDKAELPKETKIVDLSQGNGNKIRPDDTVIFHIMSKSSKDSSPERGTWKEGMYGYAVQRAPKDLVGKKIGSRVLIYYPAQNDQQPDAILVVDLVGVISAGQK